MVEVFCGISLTDTKVTSNFGFGPLTKENIESYGPKKGQPAHWNNVYAAVCNMRGNGVAKDAPVDSIGCAMLGDKDVDPKVFRFHILVSLMLSSQTKDAITAEACGNLKKGLPGGLTPESIQKVSEAKIDSMICRTGFHKRKASYLKRTADILVSDYGSDIPDTVEKLCTLPGVGPKMSFLAMQEAWKNTVGIGVDVHVHRISNWLKWVKTKNPEQTRKELEGWLPKHLWGPINQLFVGFGQTVCSARNPKCGECEAAEWCPVGRSTFRKKNKDSKKSQKTQETKSSKYFDKTSTSSSAASSDTTPKETPEKSSRKKSVKKRNVSQSSETSPKKRRVQPRRTVRKTVKYTE